MDEAQLWEAFLGGDKKALSRIYLAYFDDLYCYGVKLCSDKELVKDCIQDLFLKLWKNRQNLRQVQQIKPYLLKSLRNHVFDSLEIWRIASAIDANFSVTDQTILVEEDFAKGIGMTSDELRERLNTAIMELTARQKELIYLRYTEGLDFNNISMITDLQIQSIRNSLCRALDSLRRIIK